MNKSYYFLINLIQHAYKNRSTYIEIDVNSFIIQFLDVLLREGYIERYRFQKERKGMRVRIFLKYFHGSGVLVGIKQISDSKRRVFLNFKNLNYPGTGTYVFVTKEGLFTYDEIIARKLGGLLLCYIY